MGSMSHRDISKTLLALNPGCAFARDPPAYCFRTREVCAEQINVQGFARGWSASR